MEAYLTRSAAAAGLGAALTVLSLLAGAGCGGGDRPGPAAFQPRPAVPAGAPAAGAVPRDARAALLDGEPITWEELRPVLSEAAGGQALQEVVLGRLLDAELRARRAAVTAADVESERALLLASVARDAAATPDDAERLLAQVRRARNLGDHRFEALLRRNAQMRRLVAGSVVVGDDEVRQAFEIAHGARYRARVIVVPTEREAAALRAEILGARPGEEPPAAPDPVAVARRFADAAARHSTDGSAARGGAMDPISPADPAYPGAAREALARLEVGAVSPIVPAERGFALLLLEGKVPPDGTDFASAQESIRAEVRTRRERLAMDELARRLLRAANLSIMDRTLEWSWRNSLGDR